MAKKVGLDYDQMHFMRIEAYTRKIQQLYLSAIREASLISEGVKLKGEDQFTFDKYPKTKQRIDKLIAGLNTQMYSSLQEMTHDEWLAASYKSDALVDYIKGKTKLPTSLLEKYQSRNLEALSSFQQRKINGLNLSDRVWNYTNQFKGEIELGLDLGLGEGKSAAEISRDLRSYLNDPDKLFRRVRDKHGNLALSKNAQKYNPGAGVYRSSYKNAMRLTRTEVNMAYRTSDYERNQQLDFVVGFEVRRSNHIFSCPVCESLKGKYPKTFKFVGWHPQCRCHCIAITSTQEEFIEHEKKLLAGEESVLKSKNEVSDVPDNFKGWLATNKDRLDNAKSKPYFIKDNQQFIKATEQKSDAYIEKLSEIILKATKDELQHLYSTDERFRDIADLLTSYTEGAYKDVIDIQYKMHYGEEFDNLFKRILPITPKNVFKKQDLDVMSEFNRNRKVDAAIRDVEELIRLSKNDGSIFRGFAQNNNFDIDGNEIFKIPKEGEAYKINVMTSFTKSEDIAYNFSLGKTPSNPSPRPPQLSIVYEIKNGHGLDISNFSPYKQQEILTQGEYIVEKVIVEEINISKNSRRFTVEKVKIILREK